MNYYYGIYFTAKSGEKMFKFGSGTDDRRAYMERTLTCRGFTSIFGEQVDTGDFGHRKLEAAVHARHAATRSWGYRGMFDGSTEVWPASEGPAMMRTAAKILAAMKNGAKFDEPESSEAVIDLVHNTITNMPNHKQLNVLDLCSGDGALSNNLVGQVARIQQVTIDPPATLPGDVPNFDIQVVPGDVLAIPDGHRADVVIMNPPFSDRKETGSKTSNNGFWQFVRKAQSLAPVVIFIAPQTWESALAKEDRVGIYEVMEYAADFGRHPTASVIRWTAGPEFKIVGGRDDRRPKMPKFNVEVLSSDRVKRIAFGYGVTEFGKLIVPGDEASPMASLLSGEDAEACARWVVANRAALVAWWGAPANGHGKVRISAIKELLA